MIFTGRTEHFIVKTCNNGSYLMVRYKDKVVTIHSKNFKFPGRLTLRPISAQTAFVRVVTPGQMEYKNYCTAVTKEKKRGFIIQIASQHAGEPLILSLLPFKLWIC